MGPEEEYSLGETIAIDEDSPEDTTEKIDVKEILMRVINQLPEKQKLVVALYYYENLTYKEIADVQNVSIPTVQRQYHSGIDRLRVLLNGEVQT